MNEQKDFKKWLSIQIFWENGDSTVITQKEVEKMILGANIVEQLGNAVTQAKRLKDIHMEV